jgi:hypothetical protein
MLSPTNLIVLAMLLTPRPAIAQSGGGGGGSGADRPAVLQRAARPADPQSNFLISPVLVCPRQFLMQLSQINPAGALRLRHNRPTLAMSFKEALIP